MSRWTAGLAVALIALSPGIALGQPAISAGEIFDIAETGVGSPYVWGGGCWDPANRSRLGADCSGYVAKVWQVPERSDVTSCSHPYSTDSFLNQTTHWDAIDRGETRAADALVYRSGGSGHIVLFESGDPWGNSVVYEARGTDYGIVHRTRAMDSSYRARRRRALVADGPDGPDPVVPGAHPELVLSAETDSIDGQSRDFCTLDGSQGIHDSVVGQVVTERLYVTNEGGAIATDVVVGIEVDGPYFSVREYEVFDDHVDNACGGAWCPNDANDHPDNPPLDSPGQAFFLHLYNISPGETKLIFIDMAGMDASFSAGVRPEVRVWIRSIQDYYFKQTFDGAFDNVGGLQDWNGGDLKVSVGHTVIDDEQCNGLDDDCDGVADGGLGIGEPCSIGSGPCAGEGFLACASDGGVFCDVQVANPSDEICGNAEDDDCDGLVDEGCGGDPDPGIDPSVDLDLDPGAEGSSPGLQPSGDGFIGMEGSCACRAVPATPSSRRGSLLLFLGTLVAFASQRRRCQRRREQP